MSRKEPFDVILACDQCGKEFHCVHRKRLEAAHHFCSKDCESRYRQENGPNRFPCSQCGKPVYVKPEHQKMYKEHFCCMICHAEWKKTHQFGENNPNFGNRGSNNPLWKSDIHITNYGYYKRRVPDHPFADCDGFVKVHRLVAEEYLLTEENSVEINGKRYLKREYDVHHIDHNKLNNDPANLLILTRSERAKLHQHEKRRQ